MRTIDRIRIQRMLLEGYSAQLISLLTGVSEERVNVQICLTSRENDIFNRKMKRWVKQRELGWRRILRQRVEEDRLIKELFGDRLPLLKSIAAIGGTA